MFCINTVVTNHFEVLVRDMNNQAFYKINDGEAFCTRLVILMPGVMKRHGVTIVRINSGGSNNRSSEISADILNGDIRRAEIGFGTDIKTIRVILVNLVFKFLKRRSQFKGELLQKDFTDRRRKR